MSCDPQRLPEYLGHILDAIERIHSYVEDVDEVGFLSSKIIQDAVIRNLEVIGEASRNIERVHPEFAADVLMALGCQRDALGSDGVSLAALSRVLGMKATPEGDRRILDALKGLVPALSELRYSEADGLVRAGDVLQ